MQSQSLGEQFAGGIGLCAASRLGLLLLSAEMAAWVYRKVQPKTRAYRSPVTAVFNGGFIFSPPPLRG
ncbi:hypothetical protein CEXT_286721 [Caerostris extrusa]|uniref:Cytochrome P450 n=1 Tax=Caerostris extrusa TaxID=172846 RepID=A0AAV4MGP7_CAEEX|nr:hypothetical protein CEXT_286721 [Caerostris extrusa]